VGYLRIKIGIFSEYSSGRSPAAAGVIPALARKGSAGKAPASHRSALAPCRRPFMWFCTPSAVSPAVSAAHGLTPGPSHRSGGCLCHEFVPVFGGFSEQKWFFERFVPDLTGFSEQIDDFSAIAASLHPADSTRSPSYCETLYKNYFKRSFSGCILVLFYIYLQPKRTIMAQTAFTVRMDSETKKRFDELCKDFGMSANTALNLFARTVVKQERIPFDVESEREIRQKELSRRFGEVVDELRAEALRNGVSDMTLEEINSIIKETRAQMKKEEKK
jgi:DNA-damage-inducible protein J